MLRKNRRKNTTQPTKRILRTGCGSIKHHKQYIHMATQLHTVAHTRTQLHTHAHSDTHARTSEKKSRKKNNWKRACTARWSITNRHARHTNQRQSSQTMVSAHKSRKQKCETTHAQQSRETEKSATCVVKKKTKKNAAAAKKVYKDSTFASFVV